MRGVLLGCIRCYQKRYVATAPQDVSQASPCVTQQHQQGHQPKRRVLADSACGEFVRFNEARRRRCDGGAIACWPAVCAGVVAVLCYLNSLDGEFVHDDMVAIVGNSDVTGDHGARSCPATVFTLDERLLGATNGRCTQPQVLQTSHRP
ncbi:hypothetical protein HPB48_021136 [Haemaphysalis longicornis]|uniref:Uncharacterized protein n=1 Tax=Haemaphysalis longicornis TaxID=44386 RepID=A0A9J6H4X0_HAELO|nr:hypothetical protein HPB48_021136 [Haemaphysalis longicornis]